MSDRTIHNNRSGEDLAVCLIHTSRRRNTFHTPLRWLVYTEVLNPSVLRSSWCKALSTPAVTPGCQRHHQRHLSQLWPNHCHRHHHHHRCVVIVNHYHQHGSCHDDHHHQPFYRWQLVRRPLCLDPITTNPQYLFSFTFRVIHPKAFKP